jgi:hypothetical protein
LISFVSRNLIPGYGAVLLVALLALAGCTGGEETAAAEPAAGQQQAEQAPRAVDPRERLAEINPAIPFYGGAAYDGDLTRQDNATIGRRYGNGTVVYTLTTTDSFPQVWHYYVTYLAQFRQFDPLPSFPPSNQVQRSIDVQLNQVMKDPFVPGDSLQPSDQNVTLQVAENDTRSRTTIRYIVRPPQPQAQVVAAGQSADSSDATAR